MKARSLRVVLAFYSSEEEAQAEGTRRALKGRGRTCVISSATRTVPENFRRYAPLRLEGESLIIIEADASRADEAVAALRSAGSPAVFVIREDFGAAPGSEIPEPPLILDERTRRGILAGIRANSRAIEDARMDLLEAVRLDHALTPAAEWILDNSYLIRTQLAEVQKHLPRDYNAIAAPSAGAGVSALARELVASADRVVNETNICEALEAYQRERPLTIAELWAFGLLIQLALVESLSGLAVHVARAQQARESAYLWANRLANAVRLSEGEFGRLLRVLGNEPVSHERNFVTALAEQLQDAESALAPAQEWIQEHFGASVSEIVREQHTREAAAVISTSNAFGSLRTLSHLDFTGVFEQVSVVDATLRKDPAGIYEKSDFRTRDRCRKVVEQTARYSAATEVDVAQLAVRLAAESGEARSNYAAWYLLSVEGRDRLESVLHARTPFGERVIRGSRRHATPLYVGSIAALTIAFAVVSCMLAADAGISSIPALVVLAILASFPLSEFSLQIVNALVVSMAPPEPLARFDFRDRVPPDCATLVVVPMMLTNLEVVRTELEKLEVRFLGNRDENVYYALFSDFTDSPTAATAADDGLLAAMQDGIGQLNERYREAFGERFLLFHRERTWSESEQKWIGRERKRGKIEDLNAYLSGDGREEILRAGHLPVTIAFVITLDSDTQLPPESARRLIETMAHPLNRVSVDPQKRVRRSGYAIIQPRVSITLPGATATRFTRIFADATGTDPYCQTVSDAQQDLFLEAIFHGKAIYEVRAFHAIAGDRFPPESILSHDLIEGAHAGVGLASDIELFEHIPIDYASFAIRQHRWIRGDWQIARWTLRHVRNASRRLEPNPLTLINRWRIFDNLRRSLVPVASLLLLLAGWLISPAPAVWSLVVGLAIVIPAFAPLLDRVGRRVEGSVHRWQGAGDELARAVVMITFLPHQAWLAGDAIARALYRIFFSRRRLLEWRTAEHALTEAHRHRDATYRQMLVVSALSAALGAVLIAKHSIAPTGVFIALWIASPVLMRWLARPAPSLSRTALSPQDTAFLRRLSRLTWRYFDDNAGPATNWLPPDNSQLALRVEVADRTSPTNIGFWLTSLLAARDFGYITTDELCRRSANTFDTLGRMERYEGHWLNWYTLSDLTPLSPRYVSTVDSGNLLAALWVAAQGYADAMRAPIIGAAVLRGLTDTLDILENSWENDPSAAPALGALRRLLRGPAHGHELISRLRMTKAPIEKLDETQRWRAGRSDDRIYWSGRLNAELGLWLTTADRYLRWMETLALPPDENLRAAAPECVKLRHRALRHMPAIEALAERGEPALEAFIESLDALKAAAALPANLAEWLGQLKADYASARANAGATLSELKRLMSIADAYANGIDMKFLYDEPRRLFGVGYAVGGPREFTSHYDLIASECRLASLVAIAKGDVPVEHWVALHRPYSHTKAGSALLSWSGTMFEYLMPVLFTRIYSHSMLESACADAVARQIEFGNAEGIPWGVSESAWSAIDSHQVYQYRAFGVPALALNPGVQEELVVAPYAAAMALMVNPGAAAANLRRLWDAGLEGPMGLYESIDYTRERKREGGRGVVIYCYMAHHQGMSLAALNNVLHRDVLQRRFHRDLRIRAVESLLFEGNPITRLPREEEPRRAAPVRLAASEDSADRVWTEETASPRVFLYGNGRYALMTTNSGGGYSRWNEFDITRWRSDTTLDSFGTFIYIRDLRSDEVWGATHKPFPAVQGESVIRFAADRSEMRRRNAGIETVLEVTVAAEDDVELRRLRVTNRSLRTRQIELTSYVELAMAPHGADKAHPAFSKLFVETECPEPGVLLAHRRPRSPSDPPIWTAHILIGRKASQYETDRARFLGRGNGPANPAALRTNLSGATGTVIDPIFSLRCQLRLDARERTELTFAVIAGPTREAVLDLAQKYLRPESTGRAFEMAWTRTQLEFRYLRIGAGAAHRFQELAGHLIYPSARLRAPAERLARNRLGQRNLWAYGISGDLPILAVTAGDPRQLSLIREVLTAHAYWRLRGFRADLVILNQESPSYDAPLRQELLRQIYARAAEAGTDRPGGVFLRDWHAISEDGINLLLASAAVLLSANRGNLLQQLAGGAEAPAPDVLTRSRTGMEYPEDPLPFLELPYFNGTGGFTPDGKEYAIYLKPGAMTPAPWVNVMAGPDFGAMVSESGLGYTWFGNSQTNRLTPWQNDPVSDPQEEAIYLRDDETGEVWSPTPLPARDNEAYRTRHGHGYTVFEHNGYAVGQELTVFVPLDQNGATEPVKICRLRLRNDSPRPRRITVTSYVGWTLGSVREDQRLRVYASCDEASGAVVATQHWTAGFTERVAFAASSPRPSSWTGDRTQFFGRNGSPARPAALNLVRLDNRCTAGVDPCAALQVPVFLDRGATAEIVFLLGEAADRESVRRIAAKYRDAAAVEAALASAKRSWESILGAVQVKTPVLSIDLILNGWLLYQALSCRFWGRSAFYQSSGAIGFRDQLQDSMAFVYAAPQLTREHILTAASRQFAEGDVQHWWHPESGNGVRTLCSDDLLWLPFVVAHYVRITGDTSILDQEARFLEGPPLAPGEHERMFEPAASRESGTIEDHCRRAISRAWKIGSHGLPLFGNGDWNDGMNLVGAEGRGESVWLAWFFCAAVEAFSVVARGPDPEWRPKIDRLRNAAEAGAWDGEWYLRGYFDDGSPLGSHANPEARIDSLPQSWAVISGAADPARAQQAMESAQRWLVRKRDSLILLFDPPFDRSAPNPGYIMGYPPGVRENGGQYTHGSLWMAVAWARLGDGARAAELLQMMNPIELTRRPEDVVRYRGEPYAAAADVLSSRGRAGQAGWTWYTGSAGWMYRAWIEGVLGLRVRGDHFTVEPAVPPEWEGFSIVWRHRGTEYRITVRRAEREQAGAAEPEVIQLVENAGLVEVSVILPMTESTPPVTPEAGIPLLSEA